MQEFHIHRRIRDLYHFDLSLYELDGNVAFANLRAVRKFVQTINAHLDPTTAAKKNITASQINALGLIDEILHFIFGIYREEVCPDALSGAYTQLCQQFSTDRVDHTLRQFCLDFPPLTVYRSDISLEEYLGTESNKLATLEEMILLWLANTNPAFMQYGEFFDDTALTKNSLYPDIMAFLREYYRSRPTFGPDQQNILTLLHAPVVAAPYSLEGQLQFIRTHWANLIQKFMLRILGGEDLLREESKIAFGGPGPARIPDYAALRQIMDLDRERFSPDSDWMPRVVLIARNTYVWLDQLSKKYRRPIHRLDQIPDEELDQLAREGMTALWLIGLWERSQASEKIKRKCGNPEAVASAYSILDYRIAGDLGGEEALQNLKARAWQRGIRLASDMVPNHMGIDSNWVMQHPDYFISVDESPYPTYSFNSENLSPDRNIGIYIEDHYYDRSDAAVVFKRVDFTSGETRYIYHGNDGTTMPWNDTAQLNYLSPNVREEVIQLILRVARDFPIIRFDAAMTLAKKHFERLWYPEPGQGGAIPSRSEHALSQQDFNRAIPEEFWREVVDRVAREVPDTLLLAEAFWLMESYFVRTLGMHRVYNSAFMNMLRDEENAQYRGLIKNTLEFDPEILKRFVNFMNNPDERTAVDQFGKGDKYFGICTLMVTLPGLPMFGHGQVEGLAEKYGMEYRRAYLDEQPDEELIRRHEREIFPLTHQRYLFSGVENFCLYDYYLPNGSVDENVFAYSNGSLDQRTLVVYYNKYANTDGWIRMSTAMLDKSAENTHFIQKSLGQGLGLHASGDYYVIFHELKTDTETLYRSSDIHRQGMHFHLDAYGCQVFDRIQEVQEEPDGIWGKLYEQIGSKPVSSVFHALRGLRFQALHLAARNLFEYSHENPPEIAPGDPPNNGPQREALVNAFLQTFCQTAHLPCERIPSVYEAIEQSLQTLDDIARHRSPAIFTPSIYWKRVSDEVYAWWHHSPAELLSAQIWAVLRHLHLLIVSGDPEIGRTWLDEYALEEPIRNVFESLDLEEGVIHHTIRWIFLAVRDQDRFAFHPEISMADSIDAAFSDPETAHHLSIHLDNGILWYQKEGMETWLAWRKLLLCAVCLDPSRQTPSEKLELFVTQANFEFRLQNAAASSGYQVNPLLAAIHSSP